jgi:hypothetical protein
MQNMRKFVICVLLVSGICCAASKPHSVSFGKWTQIELMGEGGQPVELKIRALIVDGRTKEFVAGPPHEVTERTFVVQRVFRLNDSLPQEPGKIRWQWQRGGWLFTDRLSGKVQPVSLSDFDPEVSSVNWFRDYAAYCGISDDGKKTFAMVSQLGRRKPLLKRTLVTSPEMKSEICPAPAWERGPVRVVFQPGGGEKFSYEVRSRTVDVVEEEGEE